MKKIEMTIRPTRLDETRSIFTAAGVRGVSVTELKSFDGPDDHQGGTYRGVDYSVDWAPKLKLEAVVSDEKVDTVVDTLRRSLPMKRILEEPILVLDVDDAIRARTADLKVPVLR